MGIQTQLDILEETVSDIKEAIVNQDQILNESDPLYPTLPEAILNISSGATDQSLLKQILQGTVVSFEDNTIVYIRPYCFEGCNLLESALFSALLKIEIYAFNNCQAFSTLILPNTSVCILRSVNAFENTLIGAGDGYIYVPDDLWETYQTADNWIDLQNQILPISQLS